MESQSADGSDCRLEPLKPESPPDLGHNKQRRIINFRKRRTASNSPSHTTSSGSEHSSESIPLPSLHGSLMRSQKQKNPYRYYDVVKVLGEGSMGSVSKVRKRQSAIGGSARTTFVESEKRKNWCFGLSCFFIFCPVRVDETTKSGLFLHTIKEHSSEPSDHQNLPSRAIKTEKSTLKTSDSSDSSSIIAYGRKEKDASYALKSIHIDRVRDSVYRQELLNEISILQTLDHPNIVKAIETFDYHDRMYLVLELCSGGDLYSRDPYDEEQARKIIYSVVDAVNYMHSKGITHRDLKYENIMFSHPSTYSVKLIDFGLSKKYAMKEHLHDTVGTVYTMAPEVLKGDYDNKVDLWSIGVIAFMLLSSSLPFYGKTRKHVVRRILRGRWTFKGDRWNEVSQVAKDFVISLLAMNASDRPSAEKTLQMTWLKRSKSSAPISYLLMDNVSASIRTFATYERLKKLALLVVAYKSTDEELGFLRRIFGKFDSKNSGEIERDEFKEALAVYQYDDEELEKMFTAMDIDATGKVHYSEFLAAAIEAHGAIDETRIAEAFDRLDSDDSGFITVENLKEFLGDEISEEYIDSIIEEVDENDDHKIEYQEFLDLWSEKSATNLKNNLVDVYKRRETYESDDLDDLSRTSSMSTDQDMDLSGVSSSDNHMEKQGGYFFEVEKGKSMRGVWL